MRLFGFRSLAGRMFLLLTLAVLSAQLVSFAVYLYDRRAMISLVTEELLIGRIPPSVEILRELSPTRQEAFTEVLNSRWTRYRVETAPLVAPSAPAHPLAVRLAENLALPEAAVRVTVVTPQDSRYSTGATEFAQVLQIAVQLDEERWLNVERPQRMSLWRHADRMFLSLFLSIAAVLVAAAFLARRISRPLGALSEAAERFGRGELARKLPPQGPEDVARTIRAFNLMSERLQRFVSDRTRMLAAVSHDLRTPITALRIRAEMIDDEALRGRINGLLEEMEHMVDSTLQFARADVVAEPTEPVDVAELVERAVHDVDPRGERTTFVAAEAPLLISGRPKALARAMRNVVENAVRYGERAEVKVQSEPQQARILVRDRGPGIPEPEQERVFEPFVRLEGSRSTETGGSGLGLTIARTIVHAHGGEIGLENRPEGLELSIVLPKAVAGG